MSSQLFFRKSSNIICNSCILRAFRLQLCISRESSTTYIKRFYKNVTITQANGGYEVNLDQKKLKTPDGNLFHVPSYALALAVSNEWNAQVDVIKRHTMYMTTLCNGTIDNPTQTSKEVKINSMLDFLETDTICYRMEQPPELLAFQEAQWDPILNWVNERYGVDIAATTGLEVPYIPESTKDVFRQHLHSHNRWAITGYQQAVEVTKSMILAFALMDRFLDVPITLKLSRLELLFQTGKWGTVEWYHDIEMHAQQAKLAAAVLFVHLNTETTTTKIKSAQHHS